MKKLSLYILSVVSFLNYSMIQSEELFRARREDVEHQSGRTERPEDAQHLRDIRARRAYTDARGVAQDAWRGVKQGTKAVAQGTAEFFVPGYKAPTTHQASDDFVDQRKAEDEKASKRTGDLESDIERNIAERAQFRSSFKVWDREGYKREMRQKIDAYADDIAEKVGLNPAQKAELKRALSEGLMKNPEMLHSIGRMFGKGASVVGGFAWDVGATVGTGGTYLSSTGTSATAAALDIDSRGTDARAFDYRSTAKRLADVVAKPPFDILDKKLNLTDEQKQKLDKYRDSVVSSLDYQVRTMYDDVRHAIAKVPYDAVRYGLMLIIIATVITISIEIAAHVK